MQGWAGPAAVCLALKDNWVGGYDLLTQSSGAAPEGACGAVISLVCPQDPTLEFSPAGSAHWLSWEHVKGPP